jgi:HSP20 family protein
MFTLDLLKFYSMFPNYNDFRIPMWSDSKETDEKLTIKVVIPGYNKEDFNLFIEDNKLFLEINQENKKKLTYSIWYKSIQEYYLFDKAKAEYVSGILKITIPKSKVEKKLVPIIIK